ncbi:LysM peptidoglycan-binding domain-containing protein [Aquisalimonas lutea]|uniref:LysM peptidoglycan-binding domain-containing protein n=1 Tax=Aquisalimonas lutea TaxID=1327750 RepID=UPI0025B317A0|nr:LysM peptidoglycan-binding domain-containing protein [Aquisalimonas lutea]MDN3518990.1 LysM peptidoglycan-binding domain-containing protein [Aquisalimonas lutea]
MVSIRTLLLLASSLVLTACAHMTGLHDDDNGSASARGTPPQSAQPLPAAEVALLEQQGVLFPGIVLQPTPEYTEPEESGSTYPDDLWARLRSGYGIDADLDNPRVVSELNTFSRQQAYLDRVARRAEPYLHYIVESIEDRGLPMEIALLPVVESAYRPFAYSHGRAAGLWQFVPATGRHYGLRQSWWYDGRRDVLASTEAALDYLERLGEMFDGDWLLALAAYNAGEGRVMAAVRQARSNGKPTDFWHLSLPRETRQYVPRLLAISELIKDPRAYGLELVSIPDEPYLDVVALDSQIDLALAADLAGISIEELYRLNPGFDRWATDPQGPHRIAVPIDKAEPLRNELASLSPDERMRWHRHKIQPGDNLRAIARQYNTTVRVLQQTNDINGHLIRAGEHLMVPTASADSGAYSLSASNRLSRQQNRERPGQRVDYTVRSGDTLWDLSRRYNVDMGNLAEWNGMAPGDPLRPGQELVIWVRDGSVQEVASGPPRSEPVMQSINYRVRRGDSLYAIAQRFNVSVQQLQRWNNIDPDSYLQPGDTLSLKVDVRNQRGSI